MANVLLISLQIAKWSILEQDFSVAGGELSEFSLAVLICVVLLVDYSLSPPLALYTPLYLSLLTSLSPSLLTSLFLSLLLPLPQLPLKK